SYPAARTAAIVESKFAVAPLGTTTCTTFAVHPVTGVPVVTKRTWRTPPVSAAERLNTSSTPAAQARMDGATAVNRLGLSAATTYIACTRSPSVPLPSQGTVVL